jgi:uncharacterized protein YbjT (DUF2867 family)
MIFTGHRCGARGEGSDQCSALSPSAINKAGQGIFLASKRSTPESGPRRNQGKLQHRISHPMPRMKPLPFESLTWEAFSSSPRRISIMTRTLVIGATGNIGRQVVLHLVANDQPVRALTRKPEEAGMPPQVELVQGDLTSAESLDACLGGIDAVFMVWTAPLAAFAPALERIAKYARRIVFLSAPLKTPHPFFQQPNPSRIQTEQIEKMIETSKLDWTFLRPGMLASNSPQWWARQICAGDLVRWPYLSVPTAPIDERDIAAVALRTLCDDGHAGAEYVLTGPQSLSQFEQISTIGRVLGRRVTIDEIPPDEAQRELSATMPAPIVKMLLDAWSAGVGLPAFVTSTVAEITGAPARTFLEWATDHAADFTLP